MDEVEIEVFRAGGQASRGITGEDLVALATGYDGSNPVPITIGHPKSDSPAYGEVSAFRAAGNSLFATLKNVGQEIVDGIKGGKLLNRSMAFFSPTHEANPTPGKLAPRHLGFLGGSAPGIPNMPRLDKALAFSSDADTITIEGDPAPAVVYEATPTPVLSFTAPAQEPTMDPENNTPTAEQLAEDRRKLDAERAEFAASQRTARAAANAAIVDGLISGGKLLPASRDRALFVFNALGDKDHDDKVLEFDAGDGKAKLSPAAALADLLGSGAKLVPVGEGRKSPSTAFTADADRADANSITAAARKLMKEDESLSFEAAVERVTEQQEG